MRPVLFRWRGADVPSYPAMLAVGMIAGLAAGNVAANAADMNAARVYVATVLLLPVALLGARLATVVAHRQVFRASPGSILRRSQGGQAMYGGLLSVPLSLPLLAALDVPFWAFWDVATFTMVTGMVFARIGCLLTGCCAGRPTRGRLGMVLPDVLGDRVRRVPTQVLEAGAGVTLLVGAVGLASADLPEGSVFALSLALYSAARMLLQGLRATTATRPAAVRMASLALFALSLLSLLRST